jgi:hypothetical protein
MEKIIPVAIPDGVWVLVTGTSNHMTGMRSALTQLDTKVRGSVRFGDGSRYGFSSQQDQNSGHKVLTEVYYIPQLKSNIVSLGQLEEKGFKFVGEDGRLCVLDQDRTLLISAHRVGNRLYLAKFGLTPPVCLLG